MTGVQRFLSGNNNKIRTAAIISGPVKPITDAVVQKPVARSGSASAGLSGTFTGSEEALYELEVMDILATVPLVTSPAFTGVGNGELDSVATTGLTARQFEVTLQDLGNVLTAASTDVQGIQVVARTPGVAGNAFKLRVTNNLVFTAQQFSLLKDLAEGTSSVQGPEFDWQTTAINADGTVPAGAKRLAFGTDQNNVYVQYKKLVSGEYSYVFEPAIKQKYAQGAQVFFVTGSYTVELYEGVTLRETYAGVVTLYDLLNAIKATSTRLLVQGAVANDRTTGGQALLEMTLRTDARAVSNTGTGSQYATGFTEVTVDPTTPTELVEATCIAATSRDAPGAGLGAEIWEVRGSVSGLILDAIKSGELINAATFAARIPQKIPTGYTAHARGDFTVKEVNYDEFKNRANNEDGTFTPPEPPICMQSMTLGVNAQEKLVTLTYKKRPVVDNCDCDPTRGPALNPFCLGLISTPEGAANMPYSAGTVTRLISLYDWFADTVRTNSEYFSDATNPYVQQDPFIQQPKNNPLFPDRANFAFVSLFEMVKRFEQTVADIDKLPAGAYRTAAETAWDDAVTEFEGDVDNNLSNVPVPVESEAQLAYEALTAGQAVCTFEVSAGVVKIRKAVPGGIKYGFVKASFLVGAMATIFFYGENVAVTTTETTGTPGPVASQQYSPSVTTPGNWVKHGTTATVGDPEYLGGFTLDRISATAGVAPFPSSDPNVWGYAVLSDRYVSRLKFVLISGGISPLGKGDPNAVGGDGCWEDTGEDHWWEVVDDSGASYAPAFTNTPYYSSKQYPGGVVVNGVTTPTPGYYTTKEFGFVVAVTCPQNLVPGDQVVLRIGNAGVDGTYVKGDKLQLGLVAATDVLFQGGNDGDNIQTWSILDSVYGPRGPYMLDLDTPAPFDDTELHFQITPGTLAFAKGDTFRFALEGGHYRWRKTVNGVVGAWSATGAIALGPVLLDDGLSLTFELGASPAFATSDLYRFLALQPYAISNVQKPGFEQWQWGVTPADAVFDLGSNQDIAAIGIGFHSIPDGTVVQVSGGVAPGVYTWTEAITWNKDVIGLLFATQVARYIKLHVVNADGGIGWFYAGPALAFTNSAQVAINREYKVTRAQAPNPSAAFKGRSMGGKVEWPEGYLREADYSPLTAMLDWLKSNDDEAFIFFPQETRPSEVVLATVDSDAIAFNDVYNFQPNVGAERRISCTIPLKGVMFK
jgi:hypothetical protein